MTDNLAGTDNENRMRWIYLESPSGAKWHYEVEPAGHLWVMFGTFTDENGKTGERQPIGSLTGGMFIAFRQMLNALEGIS